MLRSCWQVLALASRATFCVEPTSDTLIRSHAYAAILAGCIPVLFDPSLPMPRPFRSDVGTYETEWAWRRRVRGIGELPGGAEALRRSNYSRFAVLEMVGGSSAPRLRPRLMRELQVMASSVAGRPRIQAMRHALAEVAPLMTYSTSPRCPVPSGGGSAPCDAFSMFALHLRALWKLKFLTRRRKP